LKTVSDDLFRLIKSLTKPEKGYFKKFAAKNASGSKQNYILLFDAVDSMDCYDEDLLRKKLKNEAFVKQLAVYKVYLFNMILKALHHYGAYENSESRLTEMLVNIKTLEAKHLYKEALKIIKKAKEMAYKYDKLKYILEVLSAERHILILMPGKNAIEKREKIYEEQLALVDRIKDFYTQSWLCDQMTILVDHLADYKDGESARRIEKIINDPALRDETKPIGYYSRMNFYHTHLIYSGSKNDNEKIFYYLDKQISHDEANSQFIDENPVNYLFALLNLLLHSSYAKKDKEVEKTIAKIAVQRAKFKNKIPRETEIMILFHSLNVEMIIYEKNCDLQKGRITAAILEKNMKVYKTEVPVNVKALLLMNLACFYILDGNFSCALKSINAVLNDPALALRTDAIEAAKILELVIHYELGNYDLLEYLAESAGKFFKGKKGNLQLEQLLISFFRAVIKVSFEEHKEMFGELNFKIKKALKELGGNNPRAYIDFAAWSESKQKGIPLVDVARAKNKHADSNK